MSRFVTTFICCCMLLCSNVCLIIVGVSNLLLWFLTILDFFLKFNLSISSLAARFLEVASVFRIWTLYSSFFLLLSRGVVIFSVTGLIVVIYSSESGVVIADKATIVGRGHRLILNSAAWIWLTVILIFSNKSFIGLNIFIHLIKVYDVLFLRW